VRKLADAIGSDYRAMIYVAAELGLRWGECAGLHVEDLDVLRRTVTVRRTLGEVNGRVVIGEPKTAAGRRTLAASEPLMAELAKHLSRQGVTASDGEASVFRAPAGGPLRYSLFRTRVWQPAVRLAGLTDLTFHGLRHSAATAWAGAGIDIRTAQHRLGHATSRLVLELYAHATTEDDRAAAQSIGDRLFAANDVADERQRAIDAP
jgi:integrase